MECVEIILLGVSLDGFLWRNVFKSKFGWRLACLLYSMWGREWGKLGKREYVWCTSRKWYCSWFGLPQVIAPHEFLIANGTREILLARVGTRVPGQFIGTGKAFSTCRPLAWKRSFAYGFGKMSLISNTWCERVSSERESERVVLPVCVRWCAFKCELFPYTLLQPINAHLWVFRGMVFGKTIGVVSTLLVELFVLVQLLLLLLLLPL